jgi:ABC-type polysaccharide/polyol phosphate transport system ATPase subunit
MNQPFHSSALPSTLANRAFILISHDPNTIKKYYENAVVLSDGRLYAFPDVDSAYAFYMETLTNKPESIEQWSM